MMRKEKGNRNGRVIRENRQDKSGGHGSRLRTQEFWIEDRRGWRKFEDQESRGSHPKTEKKKKNTIYHGLHSKRAHDSNLYLCSYSADSFFCPRLVSAAEKPMGRRKKELLLPRTMDQQPINVQYSTISR
ncbi:hypothetical protein CEXT_613731 [Caerostris extrusa]|uniref:Uncharacterized protein n=1 Tax=Caerostris extrusa TaxID=172846 RepID=A0AAV4XVU9_CAEEX|nr:hypothetical protein CEXT_613731 [Caerostris extrusa]